MTFNDVISPRADHIQRIEEGYNPDILTITNAYTNIVHLLIREIDFSDVEYNQRFVQIFISEINRLSYWFEQEDNQQKGFFCAPIVSMFAIYLIHYILSRHQIEALKGSEENFRDTAGRLLEELTEKCLKADVESAFDIGLKISCRILGFNDEILSNKWVNYGEDIYFAHKLTSLVFCSYFNDSHVLILQLSMILTKNPNETFLKIISNYGTDKSIKRIFEKLDDDSVDSETIEKSTNHLKLFLYTMNKIMNNDRCALSEWSRTNRFLKYDERPLAIIEDFKEENIEITLKTLIQNKFLKSVKYSAMHNLLLFSNNRIKFILQNSQALLADNEDYENYLIEGSKHTVNRDGDKLFSLDPKYLDSINLFYYDSINDHYDAGKMYEEYYKNKDQISIEGKLENSVFNKQNLALGYFIEAIQVSTEFEDFLIDVVIKKEELKLINDEIEEFALQLLSSLAYSELNSSSLLDSKYNSIKQKLFKFKDFFDKLRTKTKNETFKYVYSKLMPSNDSHQDEVSSAKILIFKVN